MRKTKLKPKAEIRRFDIFAEWNRIKAREHHHLPDDAASAYGLAVSKIVAARKFYGYKLEQVSEWKRRAKRDEIDEPWWEHLGSRKEFERKIIERMGKSFYSRLFQLAIRRAWKEGKSYEDIRDELREGWHAQRAVE